MFQCIDDYGNNGKRRTKCKTKMEKVLKNMEKIAHKRNNRNELTKIYNVKLSWKKGLAKDFLKGPAKSMAIKKTRLKDA